MKPLIITSLIPRKGLNAKEEQGIALVLALLMGFLLIAGSSALLVRKLVERKVGAFTSYQQMAENAAISGFNHILSHLNDPRNSSYKGYLYSIDNSDNINQWSTISTTSNSDGIELEELCTPTEGSFSLPKHPVDGSTWPVDLVPLKAEGETTTLREDGSEPLEASYRLREYKSVLASDQPSGVFSIEGLVRRKDIVLARTLLTRSLDMKFIVAKNADWAIINAATFSNINNLNINGEGIILVNKDEFWLKNCSQSTLKNEVASSVSGSTSPLIWPVRERGIPGPVLYEQKRVNDIVNGKTRVWSFDDTELIDRGANCTEIACVRDEDWSTIDDFTNASGTGAIVQNEDSNTITIKADQICIGNNTESPCHLNFEYLNLSETKILIENRNRPIVIHLLSPNTTTPSPSAISTGTIRLTGSSKLCGVNQGASNCNNKPAQFVITNGHDSGDYESVCDALQGVLEFGGNRLPAAWISLQSGTISLNSNTSTRGVLWAQNICGNNYNLEVNTDSIINEAEDVWAWRTNNLWGGNGRQTIRGIRGSGMDLFEKF